MELRHLRYFVAVAEEGHVTRAAARLGIQQPPLSQQIRALESELGTPLFIRRPRGVALTEAGAVFLPEARSILARATHAAARAALAASGQIGELTIGLTTSASLHRLVPDILGRYTRLYPDVSLAIHEGNAADLTEMLSAGTVEAVFLRAVVARPVGIAFRQLAEEPMLLALPGSHHLAKGRTPIPISRLASERFILVRRHAAPGMYADLIAACRTAGFQPVVAAEVGRMLTNLNMVAAGIGISVVPASMQEIRLGGVCFRQIDSPLPLRAPVTLAIRQGEERATVRNFVEVVINATSPACGGRGRRAERAG